MARIAAGDKNSYRLIYTRAAKALARKKQELDALDTMLLVSSLE